MEDTITINSASKIIANTEPMSFIDTNTITITISREDAENALFLLNPTYDYWHTVYNAGTDSSYDGLRCHYMALSNLIDEIDSALKEEST